MIVEHQPKRQDIPKDVLLQLQTTKDYPSISDFVAAEEAQTNVVSKNEPEVSFDTSPNQQALLPGAFQKFKLGCTCKTSYENNCAHYLSNAFLLQDPNLKFPAAAAKCPHGRLIRAKELLKWFQSLGPEFKQDHSGIRDFYWLVYQESEGQGHVLIHRDKSGAFEYKGTTNLPEWPVQWHYLY